MLASLSRLETGIGLAKSDLAATLPRRIAYLEGIIFDPKFLPRTGSLMQRVQALLRITFG